MQSNPDKDYIPFEERFVKGRVANIGPKVHLTLVDFPYAEVARVPREEFPDDLSLGQVFPLFVRQVPSKTKDFCHASHRWADRSQNPWCRELPLVGSLVEGEVIAFVEDYMVIVRLKGGDLEAQLSLPHFRRVLN